MLSRNIEQVDESELNDLAERMIEEHGRLEYKSGPPNKWSRLEKSQKDAKNALRGEFLKDVTALANAEGGDLIYGFDEKKWEVSGFEETNMDGLIRELTQLLSNKVEPALRIKFKPVKLNMKDVPSEDCHALICRIPASFNAPHMIVNANKRLFVRRNNNKVGDMDYEDLKRSFINQSGWEDKLGQRRQEAQQRVERHLEGFQGDENQNAMLSVKVTPMSSLYRGNVLHGDGDLTTLNHMDYAVLYALDGQINYGGRLNIDGIRFARAHSYNSIGNYSLLLRNGSFEFLRFVWESLQCVYDDRYMADVILARLLVAVESTLCFYVVQEVEGPFLLTVDFINTQGKMFRTANQFAQRHCSEKRLNFPVVVINDISNFLEEIRPFMRIWYHALVNTEPSAEMFERCISLMDIFKRLGDQH